MANAKVKNSIFYVLFEGLKIYFSNIDKFLLYMLFPVLGQIIGLILTFGLTIGLADKVAAKAHNMHSAMLIILLLAIPGLLIFLKAFWDYMVAYVALNSMTEGAVTTGHVYDFQSHREVATRRSFKYIGFLIVIGFLTIVAILCNIIPIVGLIPTVAFWVYFILVFQVFTFEPELSVKECFKRSMELVKGNWFRTFVLMLLLGFFSIFIITEGVSVVFDCIHLTDKICSLFDFVGMALPLEYVNKALRYLKLNEISVGLISKIIYMSILSTIVAEFSLPIRSICYSLWYRILVRLKGERLYGDKKPKKSSKQSKKEKEDE